MTTPHRSGRILVGMDGSANGGAALRWALAEADLRGDDVTALYAWGYAPPEHAGGGHTFDPCYSDADADAALAAAIRAAGGPKAVARVHRRVVYSPPAGPSSTPPQTPTCWWWERGAAADSAACCSAR